MKKIGLYTIYALLLATLFVRCSDMNDIYDEYLANGERIYIGKVDSVKTFAGAERVKLRFWASDPRAKTAGFYWYPGNDSMFVDIEHATSADSFDVYIGGTESGKTIEEGNYTVRVITKDNKGHFSVPFEKIINVYGDKYRSTLSNRILKSITFDDSNGLLSLFFSGAVNSKETGIEIFYTDRSGVAGDTIIADPEITSPVEILNIDPTKGVSYRTLFLPESMAIDTFYAETEPVAIEQTVNVALNKPVSVSDILRDDFQGYYAVDGVIADASRWVSSASGEHWIEIDLQQEYPIHSFETWNGSSGQVNTPLPDFRFQAEINGEWQTLVEETNNANANYVGTFNETTTSKVRFITNTQTRLFEIAVYVTYRY